MNIDMLVNRVEKLVQEFEPGGKLLRHWTLDGGISSHMLAVEIERPNGQIVRRIARQPNPYTVASSAYPAEREFLTLKAVRLAGVPAPEPVYLEPMRDGGESPLYFLEYIEGKPNLSPKDPSAFVATYATELARIHQVDWAKEDWDFLPRQGFLPMTKRQGEANTLLRESEIVTALAGWTPTASTPALRHGDFWPGNLIWQDDHFAGVIDWEETCIGEPLSDLAICRLDLAWVLGDDASEEFTSMYTSLIHCSTAELPYWDLWASLRPIRNIGEWAGAYPKLGRPDITEATMTATHLRFVAKALASI